MCSSKNDMLDRKNPKGNNLISKGENLIFSPNDITCKISIKSGGGCAFRSFSTIA